MLKIIFVEDEEETIRPLLDLIKKEEPSITRCVFGFDEAENSIRSLRPDIVVLDLWEGKYTEGKNAGSEHLGFIWDQQFCPVIVHSALPEILLEFKNPFVRTITKGQDSPEQVLKAIREFLPHVQALKGAEEHIRNSFSIAIRDVAPAAFDFFEDDEKRNDAILRAGRRRLAALMDDYPEEGQMLASWEQYLCPPVSEDILLGDILRKVDEDDIDPR